MWWLLVVFGVIACIAPFVPFTSEPYATTFWDAFPMIVLGLAAAVLGWRPKQGYPVALAFASGFSPRTGS